MRFAITSDIHLPKEITRTTNLYSQCGYTDSFYLDFEEKVKNLTPSNIDVFIVCGDFTWNYLYFKPSMSWPFNLHLELLKEFRSWLHEDIPLIFIKGNHDFWLNTYIRSKDGKLLFDEEKYANFLYDEFKLIDDAVEFITEELNVFGEVIELGRNIYLLENTGMMIKDCFIYGFPYYEKKYLNIPWSKYKDLLILNFKNALDQVKKQSNLNEPIKTILCHHAEPPALRFIQAFYDPSCEIRGFFWGHHHNIKNELIKKLNQYGPYKCIMPEKIGWNIYVEEI